MPFALNDRKEDIGRELHTLAASLFPIHRSITGDGVRETLRILQSLAPVEVKDVTTGTQAFDWTVPPEWNIRDAFVKNRNGERVIDWRKSTLHVVNGSHPINTSLTWSELRENLHTLPQQPTLVPYRTCFFKEDWGFCLSQDDFDRLDAQGEQSYEVVIDASVKDGALTYGEVYLPGETKDEVLISAHVCHPSLANDNLSGLCVATMLAKLLQSTPKRRLSYRFVFAPATIGAIVWLSQNQHHLANIRHGLILTLLGDKGQLRYKQSRIGSAKVDQVVEYVLANSGAAYEIRPFTPFGYDERQYCSPGINLPMGCLMRTPPGEFDEYHTSADNLDFIHPAQLATATETILEVFQVLEADEYFINQKPRGEPRLGPYGLYDSLPEESDPRTLREAVQWVLNFSDGNHSLFDIARRSGLDFAVVNDAATKLLAAGLLFRKNTSDNATAG